jgi:DNA-binding NtrC family response regulator
METILVADDDPVQQKMLSMLLVGKLGYNAVTVSNGKEALDKVVSSNEDEFAAVLMDVSMPVMDGLEALSRIRRQRPDLPVLMLTSHSDTNVVVNAVKNGASDFIVKPVNPTQLDVALKNCIRLASLSKEVMRLRRDKEGALSFTDIIGHNKGLAAQVALGKRAANTDVSVMISGETGSGKELFARAIHGESKRMGAPFVAINCGAIPENLVESTLFGHEKGSFTGAINRTLGKFREAEGGTLFLDEIGDLPLDAQVKLLRAVQQKEIEPVGASKPVKVNVRIISASNKDLHEEVLANRFREDLYFRLNVLEVRLPPLRERQQDILQLAEYFIQKFVTQENLQIKKLADDAKDYLVHHPWPGNVREFENLIHRALVLCEDNLIDKKYLSQIHKNVHVNLPEALPATQPSGLFIELQNPGGDFKTANQIEAELMNKMLRHFDHNITKTAEALGMAKSTFYRKLKESEVK